MRRRKLTQPAERTTDQLTEEELLAREYTSADPESVENLSDDPPFAEEWEVETTYDMTARNVKVRCVFCKFPNHYTGAILLYHPSGTRCAVGHVCALKYYGIGFNNQVVDLNAKAERQSYVRRRRHAFACIPKITEEFRTLRQHSAVQLHDKLLRTWRSYFPDLSRGVCDLVSRGETLIVDRIVHDEEGERARKEKLGDSFESEKQNAKQLGQRWQLIKSVRDVVGPVAGPLFFLPGVTVAQRLDEIHARARTQFRELSRDDLRMSEIRQALQELGALLDRIKHEFDRLDALQQAFHPDNLKRIVDWANDNIEEENRRSDLFSHRKHTPGYGRYVAQGSSISVRYSPGARASLAAYRVPKRTLIDCLTEALTLKVEPH